MKRWILPVSVLVACFALTACGRSPEEAKKKLAEMQVPQTAESLIAKTKGAASEDTAKMLVQAGVDPNARQANGMTVLMSAAFNGQHDVVKVLLEKGAQVNADANGYNALSLAVERGDKATVELLLANGAEARTRAGSGLSALEKAQQQGLPEMVALLEKAAK
jgi:ankyrin repeat protein